MRKSSGRPSLALRVRNDERPGSSKKPRSSSITDGRSSTSSYRSTGIGRLSYMGRMSVGKGKPSTGVGYNMYSTSLPKRNSSGIGLRGRTDVPKDPRPITDRSYINRMIKMLCEFLTENGYRHPISVKILHTPTSKDFYRIFEFLYAYLIPSYKVGKKPEEEVPKILRVLGYPFAISKSSMFAIGSPHTWPHLLAALTWLVELIKSCLYIRKEAGGIEAIAFPHKDDDFDSISEDRIIYEYVEQTYLAFMEGEDEYDRYDEELSCVLKSKYAETDGSNDVLESENRRLTQEVEILEKEPDRLATLREQYDVVQSDVVRFDNYIKELESFVNIQETKLAETEEDMAALKLELETTLQKHGHMQSLYESQNLTPADVARARLNRQELQGQHGLLEATTEDLDQDCWRQEVTIAKSREMIETKSHEYNKLAQLLKLIPISAENAHGIDYEMKAVSHHLTQDFKSVLMLALMQLKKQCNESLCTTESQKLKEICLLEQRTELVQEAKEEIALLDRKIKTTAEEFECKKEITRREYEHALEENDAFQKEIMECLKSAETNLQDVQKELREKQKQYEQRKAELVRRKHQAAVFLHTVVSEVIDHKLLIRKKLEEVVNSHRQMLEKTKLEVHQ